MECQTVKQGGYNKLMDFGKKNKYAVDIFKDGTSGVRWDIETKKRFHNKLFLEQYGFKVYSQNDEDGIISEIFNRIGVINKRFVEFGVENGLECNTHYLLLKGWSGLWIEGNSQCYNEINKKFAPVIKTGQLKCKEAFITVDNINSLIQENGFMGEIDLLSIDIDGNDYYVWEAIDSIMPRVVIIEYNAKFPPECNWIMAYNAEHLWDGSDRQGASLKALEELGQKKGYQLVGTNLNGINAFFVKRELCKNFFPMPANAESLYNPMRFNYLTFRSGHPAFNCVVSNIEGMEGEFIYQEKYKNYMMGFGFWKEENGEEEGTFIQWMRDKSGVIFVKKEDEHNVIKIQYECYYPDIQLKVIIGGKEFKEERLQVPNGEMLIKLESVEENIVKLKLEVDKTYVLDKCLHNRDKRIVSIGISKIESYCDNKQEN